MLYILHPPLYCLIFFFVYLNPKELRDHEKLGFLTVLLTNTHTEYLFLLEFVHYKSEYFNNNKKKVLFFRYRPKKW